MTNDTLNAALLAHYAERLAGLRYQGVGTVETLTFSPEMDRHVTVAALQVLPESGVCGQYPGKQWWQGRRVPGRQISAVSADVLDVLDIPHDVPGDNLIIRGIDLARFAAGDTLRVGDALLTVTPDSASALRQAGASDKPDPHEGDQRRPPARPPAGRPRARDDPGRRSGRADPAAAR